MKENSGTISREELNKKIEKINLNIAAKNEEIRKLLMTIQHLYSEGSSVFEALRIENTELKKGVSTLSDQVLRLNAEIKILTTELLHYHVVESNKMEFLLKNLSLRPSPT